MSNSERYDLLDILFFHLMSYAYVWLILDNFDKFENQIVIPC